MACWVDTRNLQNYLTRSDPTVTLRLAPQTVPDQDNKELQQMVADLLLEKRVLKIALEKKL